MSKSVYFGKLKGSNIAAEKPYLVFKCIDDWEGWAFETFQESVACLSTKHGEWQEEGGERGESPFDIYCLMDTPDGKEWAKISCFAEG